MTKGFSNSSASRNHQVLYSKRWLFLFLLAAVAALFGGASRYDAIQIVPLRALSALFLIPAFVFLTQKDLKREAVLVSFFGLFVILIGLQVVPLPPDIWHAFPGRNAIQQLDGALGNADRWRPLSIAPLRTWNAFGSLVLPGAGLLLAIALRATPRVLLQLIGGLGVMNAALGLLQIISGRSSPLYFYELTSWGSAVGIFANENHSAIFAACTLLVVARLGLEARNEHAANWLSIFYPTAFFFILLIALISGSRAGFAASLGALLVSAFMIWLSLRRQNGKLASSPPRPWREKRPYLVSLLPLVALLLTVIAFIGLDRAPAFKEILARDSFADLRWSILPVISEILSTHWLIGSGFGSFEQVYQIFEPSDLLIPQYVNQAHNDWAQILIEGGVLAGILLAALCAWILKSIARLSHIKSAYELRLFWLSIFGIIGAASLVDYPLRTPIFQLVLIWLLLSLSGERRGGKDT